MLIDKTRVREESAYLRKLANVATMTPSSLPC